MDDILANLEKTELGRKIVNSARANLADKDAAEASLLALHLASKDNNEFGLDLFRRIVSEQKDPNIFISPTSISTCIAMATAGANGKTKDELVKALRFDADSEANDNKFRLLLAHLNKPRQTQLSVANAVWLQEDFELKPEYVSRMSENYETELEPVNYRQPATAAAKINSWCDKKTQGKITEVVSADTLSESTKLVLTNAIYFKGSWLNVFNESDTLTDFFRKEDGSEVEVQMMYQPKQRHRYFETDDSEVIELLYNDRATSMVIVLPKEGNKVDDVVKNLSTDSLDAIFKSLSFEPIDLFMPRFKVEYDRSLVDDLKGMGVELAFTDDADFRGIAETELKVGDIIHKTFVEVKEEGTEAAAVTAMTFKVCWVSIEPSPRIVRIDRPFVFFIRDKESKNLLFMGKIADPTA